MSDRTCECCGTTAERATGHTASHDHWLVERPVTTAPLLQEVGQRMIQFFGAGSIETLIDVAAAIRDAIGGRSLAIGDLCHVGTETPHCTTMAGETYHFRCFYDGIALAQLADEPVGIRTESLAGERVTVGTAPDGDIDVTPPDAAMSFGIVPM